MPDQDRAGGDQAMATQRSGDPHGEGGEHGSVRPVQAWSWVGAAQLTTGADPVPLRREAPLVRKHRACHPDGSAVREDVMVDRGRDG